jgi:predicted phosphoribosyltransferase
MNMKPDTIRVGLFRDRREAGRLLAAKLANYADRPDVVVLVQPRGGVPVAYEVASALDLPRDVFVVRKPGIPGYDELAMGAVATGGVRVLNDQLVARLGIPERVIEAVAAREQQELARRERLYRGGRPPPDVRGRTVILVDDGLATGATMHAAIAALRQLQPARILSRFRRHRPKSARRSARRSTMSFAPLRQSRSTLWASGTKISRRRRTRRFTTCSRSETHQKMLKQCKARQTARSAPWLRLASACLGHPRTHPA